MVSNITCKFCGAVNPDANDRCFSCNALLPKRQNLSEKDTESLSNYIKSIDGMLNSAKDKADSKVAPMFLILSLIGIGSIVFFYFSLYSEHRNLFWIVSIGWNFALFIVFGAFVTKYNNQTRANEFKLKIRFEIKEYLKQMHFTEADFKTVAAETLKKDATLIKFLPDL